MNQTMPAREEVAFAFKCQGDDLIGFLHKGDQRSDIGVLTLVAGGPQYRGGVGRQLVNLGRRLAADGIPVMRFDHRGLGDSEGTFKGFQSVEADIAAALDEFKRRVPTLRGVILWGGCDSATAALINAHKFPDVVCVIAGNPFVSSATTAAKVARKHYFSRLLQASFWVKLVRGKYRVGDYALAAGNKAWEKIFGSGQISPERKAAGASGSFVDDLLTGLRNFDGKVLFLMGDRFLLSEEFNTLVQSSPEWRAAYGKANFGRIDIKGGDQVFSTAAAQQQMFDAASEWIREAFPGNFIVEEPIRSPIRQSVSQ